MPGYVTVTMLPFFKADISPALLEPQWRERYAATSHPAAATQRGGPTSSIPRLLRAAFIPGTDEELWELHAWGMASADAWLASVSTTEVPVQGPY